MPVRGLPVESQHIQMREEIMRLIILRTD
jgi:hypothetical protein